MKATMKLFEVVCEVSIVKIVEVRAENEESAQDKAYEILKKRIRNRNCISIIPQPCPELIEE